MDIKLTKDQFERLFHLAYLGNWMVNAYRADDYIQEYNDAAERVYNAAPTFGFKDKIEFDELEGRTYPSAGFEDEMLDLIDEYDDASFWDLLVLKLAERDLVREYGQGAVDLMSDEELEEKEVLTPGNMKKR